MATISTLGKDRDFLKLINAYETHIKRESSKKVAIDINRFDSGIINNKNIMIFQSKMNVDFNKYNEARKFILDVPKNAWVYIKDIPEAISYPVIDFIDNGILHGKTLTLDETFEKFIVTIGRPENIMINLKRIYKP